jgi:aminoglycoside phosphotransferase family enzyme/predicted kinase
MAAPGATRVRPAVQAMSLAAAPRRPPDECKQPSAGSYATEIRILNPAKRSTPAQARQRKPVRDEPVRDEPAVREARRRVLALQAWLQDEEGSDVRLVETHISWLLLGERFAWKLRKPLRLPFLDFTALASRRRFCEEERLVNARLAPALYLDVLDVVDTSDGPRLRTREGDRPPANGGERQGRANVDRVVDAALRMRRFPDGALWTEMLSRGALEARHVDAMARSLAALHRDAAVAPADRDFGSTASIAHTARELVEAIDAWRSQQGRREAADEGDAWPGLREWLASQVPQLAPLWEARCHAGRVRECHGDLHLANVVQLDDGPTAFDAIEFDEGLRWIDVINDAAFLAMDLMAHGHRALGFRFLGAYLEASGDYDGLPVLRFYLVCRALARARVAIVRSAQDHAAVRAVDDYVNLAASLAMASDPRLAITHGLPGSGKSVLSQALVEAVGAFRVRNDVERKRLFGLSALQSSRDMVEGGIYDAASTARTYGRAQQVARLGLLAGWPMIVDATFLRRAERDAFAELAKTIRVPFTILACSAPLPVLRERIERRAASGADPSEADAQVLERLRAVAEPLSAQEGGHVVDWDGGVACGDPRRVAPRWLAARAE